MFIPLPGIHEPSAIQQLPDGRFLVVEDEKTHPLSLLALRADGSPRGVPLAVEVGDGDAGPGKLDDLEGLAVDAAGWVYAVTSHSRDGKGEERKSREKLLRFRIDGERVVAAGLTRDLKTALVATHPLLATAAAVRDVKADGGLNIEALEMTPDQRHLLIGFRSPLRESRALIARIENPDAVFAAGATPRIAPQLEALDLGGHGLRGMSHVPALGGYLLISGPVAKEQAQFRLWFWSGRAADAPRRATVPNLPGFEHAEGIAPALIDGQAKIVIVSDDGDRATGRPAHLLLFDPAQLEIAE